LCTVLEEGLLPTSEGSCKPILEEINKKERSE